MPNRSAVTYLAVDQSDYGPARGSVELKWDGERFASTLRGTEEEKVPDCWAANCHCLALIGFGLDHGVELPYHSDLREFDLIRQYLANIEQPSVSCCNKISLFFVSFNL